MATWTVIGHTTSVGSYSSATGLTISANSSLAYGGGSRGATILTAIQINTYAGSLHIGSNTSQSAADLCPSPHLHVVKWIGGSTASIDGGANIKLGSTVPHPVYCVQFKLTLSTSVAVNPVQIWGGSGASALSNVANATIQFVEANITTSPKSWTQATPNARLSLVNQGANTTHRWWSAISLMPLSVGFSSTNKVRIEATYS